MSDPTDEIMRIIHEGEPDCLSRIAAVLGYGASSIPCARCGNEYEEFTVPNDIWNAVIRQGGPERDDEYLCLACWYAALREHLAQPPVPSAFKFRKPGEGGYGWQFADWTENSQKQITVLLSRGCEVVKLYGTNETSS